MGGTTLYGGSRRARRELLRRRQERRFGRFLGLTVLGTAVPGAGLLVAGRRGWGKFFLTLVMLGVVGIGLVLWRVPPSRLAATVVDRDQLGIIAVALVVVAAGWLIVAVASHKALEPPGLSAGKRLAGSLVVILVASVIVAPMAVGARYAWTQSDLIETISQDSATTPELDKHDPWADKPRVNVLLLGSDAGEGREGVRPDTLILASMNTETGDTVMFSLPRNLEKVPFAPGTPLAQRFPGGFTNYVAGDPDYLLNAVYNHAPAEVPPEVFDGSDDAGADATKLAVGGALGLEVDYFVMADLKGFQDMVDAMGGITIDVNYPIPIASKRREDGGQGCTQPRDWILPGENQHLDGRQALWFARARCSPGHPDYAHLPNPVKDDYNRMERQRCVMGAIARRADPMSLLPRFQALATATERNIKTDVPTDLFPAFAELGLKVKDATITSLTFTNQVIPDRSNPDYEHIHALVQEALNPPQDLGASIEASNGTGQAESSADDDMADEDGGSDETGTEDGADSEPTPSPEEPVDVNATC
ncbi:MAG TPA: LCP family protein [Jiangellaceae bacterium]|nr:LCP family protein [Jiangellaceae bacterium]